MTPGHRADELGSQEDRYALESVFHCGCHLVATAHGTSFAASARSPLLHTLFQQRLFQRLILLSGRPSPNQHRGFRCGRESFGHRLQSGSAGNIIRCLSSSGSCHQRNRSRMSALQEVDHESADCLKLAGSSVSFLPAF